MLAVKQLSKETRIDPCAAAVEQGCVFVKINHRIFFILCSNT